MGPSDSTGQEDSKREGGKRNCVCRQPDTQTKTDTNREAERGTGTKAAQIKNEKKKPKRRKTPTTMTDSNARCVSWLLFLPRLQSTPTRTTMMLFSFVPLFLPSFLGLTFFQFSRNHIALFYCAHTLLSNTIPSVWRNRVFPGMSHLAQTMHQKYLHSTRINRLLISTNQQTGRRIQTPIFGTVSFFTSHQIYAVTGGA